MKKPTRSEYLKAKRIVRNYERIATRGKYQFLWSPIEREQIAEWVSAKNIDEACKKFYNKFAGNIESVDYEVALGDRFIDISDNESLKGLIG